ncbi:hypothetical protein AXF42_Ash018128 [Apostasia shenzhenica]|uniref:Serine aminopeptidase S33 domain-containing protein n=1 Tax=Apostasia shenzhenica TaxID=1088818 RepID=A0A2I0AEZ6_9ASPA|nr:hypothetical protein AXF42_Ash018128 [Apostasia shenzhenica]
MVLPGLLPVTIPFPPAPNHLHYLSCSIERSRSPLALELRAGNGVESSSAGFRWDARLLSVTRFGTLGPSREIKGEGRRTRSFAAAEPVAMWEGVDEKLAKMVSVANLDYASERRRIREVFKDVQLRIDHPLFRSIEINSKGFGIFSKSWLPSNSPIKALVCFCHGYGDTCTFFFEGIANKLAASGYGVFALDYPGSGLSDGLHGYIPTFDSLVDDVVEHFSIVKDSSSQICNPEITSSLAIKMLSKSLNVENYFHLIRTEKSEFKNLPSFLFGQSMGGAVALKVHFKQPRAWDGAVLVAPMCKMGENVVPPWPFLQFLVCVSKLFPKMKLVPSTDIAEMGFKELKKREQATYNVIAYKDKPRLKTGLELLKTTQELERHLEEVSLPLLILHGEADVLTDCLVSKALFEKASSSDKEILIYKDAYHALLEGEPDETIFQVLDDIVSWLDRHCVKAM